MITQISKIAIKYIEEIVTGANHGAHLSLSLQGVFMDNTVYLSLRDLWLLRQFTARRR